MAGGVVWRAQVPFVDLFLMHSPKGGNVLETWDAMVDLKSKGLCKAIGVSNFGTAQLEGLRQAGRPVALFFENI